MKCHVDMLMQQFNKMDAFTKADPQPQYGLCPC